MKTSNDLLLTELSMGMSADYMVAIKYNASFIRIVKNFWKTILRYLSFVFLLISLSKLKNLFKQ